MCNAHRQSNHARSGPLPPKLLTTIEKPLAEPVRNKPFVPEETFQVPACYEDTDAIMVGIGHLSHMMDPLRLIQKAPS